MKKIYLFLFISSSLYLRISAQGPKDTLLHLLNQVDSINRNISAIKTTGDTLNKTVDFLRDTVNKIVNKQLIVDGSALDSAQKFPKEVLYKTYLFSKKNYPGESKGLKWFYAILAASILIFMWTLCIRYAKKDSLCKDVSFDRAGKRIEPQLSPYSYARTQLLWWSMIILSCYVFFFGITGILFPLNVTAVILLGFGVIVYGAGKVIDDRQIAETKGTRNQDLGGQNTESPNFIKDILSDDNGISIHRFQAMIFNIAFGIGFIGFFIKSLIQYKYPFPDFTEWQFALIGISSATYLGLKAAENNDPEKKIKANSLKNLTNESFPGNDNLLASIEYHNESSINSKPPKDPPPNIK